MNDEPSPVDCPTPTHERHAWRAQFLTRVHRYKNQLTRRWWIPLTAVVLGLAFQAAVWRLQAPLYVSAGRMIVNVKLSIPEGSLYTEELNNFLGTQAALMQSAAVINRAHERVTSQLTDLDPKKVAIKALILPRTTIFVLQGAGEHARYTQAFVQACMEEYINLKKEMRAQTSDTTLAGMTEEIVRLEKELRQSDEELVSFASTNSVILLQEQGSSAAGLLARVNQRLAELKSELSLLQMLDLDHALQEQGSEQETPVLPNEVMDSIGHPETIALAGSAYRRARQQVLLLKAEHDDLSQFLRPKHPKMIGLSEEIGRRERLLAIYREQTGQQMESRKESLKLQILNLEHQAAEWDAKALEMSRRTAEFQRLKAGAQRTQALYDRLLATMQTLDLNKQISPESVTIMENASPALADQPGPVRKLLLGALAGLLIGLLALMLVDRLDDRLGSLSELQELFPEEVLGQIPREKSALRKGEPGLLQARDERYAFVEAYRNLRSSLLYMSGSEPRPRTLLVTSSVPNDGKSLTSANLAITLASAGAQVLLVDADLRKGSLHNRLGIDSPIPGLSETLAGEPDFTKGSYSSTGIFDANPSDSGETSALQSDSLTSAAVQTSPNWATSVQPTKVANLFLLPRGQTTHRSSELFLNSRTVEVLREAAHQYDFVILDTAPVMAADDVTSLAPHVDGVIFVVRAEHSSARVARAALDLLYLRHVRVLGLVFNAVRPNSADYYYYYKYKDYYNSYPTA